MGKKVEIKLNSTGVRELLKSPEIQAACMDEALKVAGRAGGGYEAQTRSYPERSGAAVVAGTEEAKRDNLRNNTLLKAMGG
jgi:hypothetical protein